MASLNKDDEFGKAKAAPAHLSTRDNGAMRKHRLINVEELKIPSMTVVTGSNSDEVTRCDDDSSGSSARVPKVARWEERRSRVFGALNRVHNFGEISLKFCSFCLHPKGNGFIQTISFCLNF